MAEYLSPAVYVEELSSGVKPLEGAGTSTAGFVGHAVKGPIGIATPINNFSEFQTRFGGFSSDALLPFGVKAFFDEGGRSCYVVRTCHYDNADQPTAIGANRTYNAIGAGTPPALRIEAASPGTWGNDLAIMIQHPAAPPATFRLQVFRNGVPVETFDGLSMDASVNDYATTRINGISSTIKVTDLIPAASPLTPADRRPTP